MKSLKTKVILSAFVLLFALVATVGSTFAWYGRVMVFSFIIFYRFNNEMINCMRTIPYTSSSSLCVSNVQHSSYQIQTLKIKELSLKVIPILHRILRCFL